jgi:hypothetical protein
LDNDDRRVSNMVAVEICFVMSWSQVLHTGLPGLLLDDGLQLGMYTVQYVELEKPRSGSDSPLLFCANVTCAQ